MNYQLKRYVSKICSFIHRASPARYRLVVRNYWNVIVGDIEPEMEHLDKIIQGGDVAVDIGANYGMYSLRLSRRFKHCHAFEINPTVVQDLKDYHFQNLTLHEIGLGSEASTEILSIPLDSKGRELSGWGTVEEDAFPAGMSVIKKEAYTISLDSLGLKGVDFIKIDVEGHECKVLEGAADTLRRCRPRILVEVKDKNIEWVDQFLSELGYLKRTLADFVPGSPTSENVIYLPNH